MTIASLILALLRFANHWLERSRRAGIKRSVLDELHREAARAENLIAAERARLERDLDRMAADELRKRHADYFRD